MKLVVLISCMYQENTDIIKKTNVQTDVVVINQCDKEEIEDFEFVNIKGENCHARFICTKERGLSRSRNMAIRNSWGDICLICDDDELLEDDYESRIIDAYNQYPNEQVILFMVERKDLPYVKKYPVAPKKVGIRQILQSSSVQVSFMRDAIINANIQFDILLGSGSGNGGGEDNKFLLDIRKAKLNLFYTPVCIGAVQKGGESLWFHGFTKQYMINRGWTTRRSLGSALGFLYILTFGIRHYKNYRPEMNCLLAYYYLFRGFFEKRKQ